MVLSLEPDQTLRLRGGCGGSVAAVLGGRREEGKGHRGGSDGRDAIRRVLKCQRSLL